MAESRSLTQLDLGSNSVRAPGARAIASALSHNPPLSLLFLYFNDVGDEGARSLSEALPHAKSLSLLDLRWNGVTAACGEVLCAAARHAPHLLALKVLGVASAHTAAVKAQLQAVLAENETREGEGALAASAVAAEQTRTRTLSAAPFPELAPVPCPRRSRFFSVPQSPTLPGVFSSLVVFPEIGTCLFSPPRVTHC